jgi:hypothetical protein
MRRLILTGAGLLALATAPALAQTDVDPPQAGGAMSLDGRLATMKLGDLEDKEVVDENGVEIGEIDDVVQGSAGVFAVIEAEDQEFAVPLNHLGVHDQDRFVLRGMTAEQVKQIPNTGKGEMTEVEDDDMTVGQAINTR